MADSHGLNLFNTDDLDDTFLLAKYYTHSTKLEFYKIYKNHYTISHYLDYTKKANERKALIKLRIGNHDMIVLGRYQQISRENI